MTPKQLQKAFADNDNKVILVRLKSGTEYWIGNDYDEQDPDPWTWGSRANGRISFRGRRKSDTRDQHRWFRLANATLVTDTEL